MSSTALKSDAHARTNPGTGWTVQKTPLKPRSLRCRRHPVQPARQKRFRRGLEGHVTRERGALRKGQWRTRQRKATLSSHAGRGGQGERACLRSLAPDRAERLLERGGGHDTCSRGGGGGGDTASGMPSALRTPVRSSGSRATRDTCCARRGRRATWLEQTLPPPSPSSVADRSEDAVQVRSVDRILGKLSRHLEWTVYFFKYKTIRQWVTARSPSTLVYPILLGGQ